MRFIARLPALLFAVVLAPFGATNTTAQVFGFFKRDTQELHYGYNCSPNPGRVQSGHDTVDGEIVISEANSTKFDVYSDQIPARVGVSFGSWLIFGETAQLKGWVSHPPMAATGTEIQTWPIHAVKGEAGGLGYLLEDEFELVPGQWVFRLLRGEDILIERVFHMFDPATRSDSEDPCRLKGS